GAGHDCTEAGFGPVAMLGDKRVSGSVIDCRARSSLKPSSFPSWIRGEQLTVRLQRPEQLQQNPRQFPAGYVEQRGVRKNAVKAALGQLRRQKILMKDLALRMRTSHGHKLPRSVERHGLVPQRSEVKEIS